MGEAVDQALHDALQFVGEFLVGEAKRNIRANASSRSGGGLMASIDYDVEGNTLTVGTNREYAIYYELGTGIFAANGDGRQDAWYIPIGESFTEEEAEFYHFPIIEHDGMKFARCHGSHPHPFLLPALANNRDRVERYITRKVMEAMKNG